ncbi:hypothetical protein [Candidatus Symbiothrix dinenymphae]|uniref:hypothetical protein n=1 Tax=Candidatus Symbiothrix dinenymphae TaxID=467085 RepID=UPI0006E3DB3B|nr:hypothetical protein [Candidatus Symbiothrix dinenymphae]GHT49126.1 hypothetical protein AGMMS49982_01880 [Bacteroidia bacterium]
MLRTVYTPQNEQCTLPIPRDYVGKKLEIIIFPVEEVISEAAFFKEKKVTFTDFGLKAPVEYKFDREEANER